MKRIQRSYNQFKKCSQVIGLGNLEVQFLNKVKQNNTKELTSSYMEKVSLQSKIENRIKLPDIKLLKKQINGLTENLLKMLDQLVLDNKTQNQSILDSKITEDIPTLLSFFEPIKINNFSLLYRASENAFSTDKFHQLCDDIPNTLVIAKTQFGKIIGGYTPLMWGVNNDKYDHKKKSFLFSLSLKTKIPLVHNSFQAINNQAGYGPIFDKYAFYIIDKANENNDNLMQIGFDGAYVHKDYSPNQESAVKLSGQTVGSYFKIIQWEVFQVEI